MKQQYIYKIFKVIVYRNINADNFQFSNTPLTNVQ